MRPSSILFNFILKSRKKKYRIFSIQCKFQACHINQQKMGQCFQILFNHLFQILIFLTFYNYKLIKQVKMRIFILFSLVLLVYPWSILSSAEPRKDGLHISDQKSTMANQNNPNQQGEISIEIFNANLKIQTEAIPHETKDEREGKIISQNRGSQNRAEQNNQDQYSKQNIVQNKKKIIKKYSSKFNEIDMKYREYLERIKPSGLRNDLNSNPSSRSQAMIFREHNYLNNVKQINLHNSKKDKSYSMGLTKFTDLNHQQFQSGYIQGGPIRRKLSIVIDNKILEDEDILLYTNVNLTDNCGPIYESGKCSSAYAFSALDAIWVTHNFIKKQKLESFFSVQQIISCMKVTPIPNQQYGGCQGGRQIDVYKYVIQNGIAMEDQYPYNLNSKEYGQNFDCEKQIISRRSKKYKKVADYRLLMTKNNCVESVKKLKQNIVLSVLIISSQKLKDYREGIYILEQQPQNLVYHCVLLIGYSHENGFLVKNSWGKSWGFSGYGYMSQSSGICQYPSYPILFQ